MAHLLRGKQAGIQNDLSAGIAPDFFAIDDIARYGVKSQVCALAYDPVQSLLAVGTRDSKFGPGQIYIFGQGRINVTLPLPRGASAQILHFCADKLVSLDSKKDLTLYSLEGQRIIASHSPPGVATTLATDPMLDYALLGMQTGDILAYDMDREAKAPLRIPNLWAEFEPRARVSPILAMAFHPRDIGTLLIGYTHGAAIYSFKQNKAIKFLQYEIPPGAPGGDADPASRNIIRRPMLTQAVWHPTGQYILTAHEDSSLVFWEPKDGKIVMARTLAETNINKPGHPSGTTLAASGSTIAVKEPIFRIAWCANQDPDDTAILIAGGSPTNMPTKGLTLFELGRTPVFATSTWDALSAHFESPRRQRILPTPPNAEVVDFCLLPRLTPHFAGAHDPIAVLAVLSSGELITLSFPSGLPISPTNQLHVSLTFVHPFIKFFNLSSMERSRWLGMTETRTQGPLILKGGAATPSPMKRHESRNIVQTAHADGTVRLWDAGNGDELENAAVLQVDVGRAVGRLEGVDITTTSLSGVSGEFAAGLRTGEVAIFRWGHNRNAGREPPISSMKNRAGALTNITDRVDSALKEGLCPFTLLATDNGAITALQVSDVGFVAAASEGGNIAVIDLRGPAIIYNTNIQELLTTSKHGSMRHRSSSNNTGKPEHGTTLSFSVMTLDGESYSSILLHAGTNLGHIATYRIVPDPSGRYSVQYVGSNSLDGRVLHVAPINAETGKAASASPNAVANLRSGFKVDGALVAVTQSEVRVFRPPTQKGAHKSFDNFLCDAAAVVRYQDQGHAVVGLFGDGSTRAFSLPALKEIGLAKLDGVMDVRRFGEAVVTPAGNILGWTGPSEMALVTVWGAGLPLQRSQDKLWNPNVLIPPRPTISNVQWISGTQYVTPTDMDILIGGPDRPPSKRMLAQQRADEQQRRTATRISGASSSATAAAAAAGQQDEGYWAYMQRQMTERTEQLGLMGDSMQNLQDNSAHWADDVGKFVSRQKKAAAMGLIKSKFGF